MTVTLDKRCGCWLVGDGVISVLLEGPVTVVTHLARRELVGREHRVHSVTLAVDHAVRQAVLVELRGVGVRSQDLLAVGVPSAIRAVQRGEVGVGVDAHVSCPQA